MSARGLRSRIGSWLHRAHLLGAAERVLREVARALQLLGNAAFRRANPRFAFPPSALVFETVGHMSAATYRETGERHARLIAGVARRALSSARPDVLEWGCGTGRVLRHIRAAGLPHAGRLAGVDVDKAAVRWCREHLPELESAMCGDAPPLPFADRSFDVVYHYSVLTHLAGESAAAWLHELARILRDDGVMIGTTHGERYTDMLLPEELRAFRAGEIVTRRWAAEGRKRFLAFHPPGAVRELLLAHFADVRMLAGEGADIPQDLWLARGPRR